MLDIRAALVDLAKHTVLCRPHGSIDATSAPYLKNVITGFIGQGHHHLVIDFNEVDYISSAGWGVILGRLREFRDIGGDIYLVAMRPAVMSVFKLMGLDTVIRSFDALETVARELGFKIAAQPVTVEAHPPGEALTPAVRPLAVAVQEIAKEHPLWRSRQIAQELNQSKRVGHRVGSFAVYRQLRALGLHTERRRLFFAFSEMKRERNEANPRT